MTQGLISSHVDDFRVCGNENCAAWNQALHQFCSRFWRSPREHTVFTHCGINVREAPDGSKILDHSRFCETLEQIPVFSDRSDKDLATESEKSQLRALLGAAQRRSYNSGPQHAAKVGLLLSQVSTATVRVLREANKLAREMHGLRNLSVRVNWLPGVQVEDVTFICWTDAAVANRADKHRWTGPAMMEGEPSPLSFMSWRSGKLQRVARSSLAAEVQAFGEGEEELMYTRLCWAEMRGHTVDPGDFEHVLQHVPGVMVTDVKSLYDVVRKGELNTAGLGLRDRYSTLGMLSVLERLQRGRTVTRWVNSDAQLADALTKPKVHSALHKVLHEHVWTLVYDERFVAAKKLRKGAETSEQSSWGV